MLAFNFFATTALALTLAVCVISGKGYKTAEDTEIQVEA
jgi:hypothetical protein